MSNFRLMILSVAVIGLMALAVAPPALALGGGSLDAAYSIDTLDTMGAIGGPYDGDVVAMATSVGGIKSDFAARSLETAYIPIMFAAPATEGGGFFGASGKSVSPTDYI